MEPVAGHHLARSKPNSRVALVSLGDVALGSSRCLPFGVDAFEPRTAPAPSVDTGSILGPFASSNPYQRLALAFQKATTQDVKVETGTPTRDLGVLGPSDPARSLKTHLGDEESTIVSARVNPRFFAGEDAVFEKGERRLGSRPAARMTAVRRRDRQDPTHSGRRPFKVGRPTPDIRTVE